MNIQISNEQRNSDVTMSEKGQLVTGNIEMAEESCCCCAAGVRQKEIVQKPPSTSEPWILKTLDTPVGIVPQVDTKLRLADHLGSWRMRWGIGRMRYRVDPGLYAVRKPAAESPVLVSANYKMSFDRLRAELAGLDAWILVIDTRGINVWCSAGKGTFGTEEIVGRVRANRLDEIVSHRTLIVPQLGAPGVAAHQVKNRCGFRVVYGPVRARDIPSFLAANMRATPEMRRVHFDVRDRIAVIPVELMHWAKWALAIAACLIILAGLGRGGYSWERATSNGLWSAALLATTFLGSTVLAPVLLPWLPGRAFSVKGFWLGAAFFLIFAGGSLFLRMPENWTILAAWGLVIPGAASFIALGYTGCTTYTSLSGVRYETRLAVPIHIVCVIAGIVLWLIGNCV
jgi:hypothetical protein